MNGMMEKIRGKLERVVPEARRFLARLDVADAFNRYRYYRNHAIALPVPPKTLRTLVGPDPGIEGFLATGQRSVNDLKRALESVNRTLESFESVLDFGCGCGRQIRWLADIPKPCRLHGTDVYVSAIRWNRRHLHFAEFESNGFYPPLPYPDGKFDLIYAISVFTHLNENDQSAWIDELRRVASPAAIVVLTTQGHYALDAIRKGFLAGSADFAARLNRHGDLSQEGAIFEPYARGGNYGMTFHDPDYVRARWGQRFRIVKFIPKGMDGWQDVTIMEKEK